MGRPEKHFANWLYERKDQNPQPVIGKTTSRELLAADPGQGERVPFAILDDAGRGIGMKLLRPLPGFAVVNLVATFVRLAVVRRQMPVDRYLPPAPSQATRQLPGERLVETAFQHGKCFGQVLLQGGHHRLVGRGAGQIAARGRDRDRSGRRPQQDVQDHRRRAFPTSIPYQLCLQQPIERPLVNFAARYATTRL